MDKETIIRMAGEAYATATIPAFMPMTTEALERFAKLVAEHVIKDAPDYKMGYADGVAVEREACAKVADVEADEWGGNSDGFYASRNIATAIRARGQA